MQKLDTGELPVFYDDLNSLEIIAGGKIATWFDLRTWAVLAEKYQKYFVTKELSIKFVNPGKTGKVKMEIYLAAETPRGKEIWCSLHQGKTLIATANLVFIEYETKRSTTKKRVRRPTHNAPKPR